MGDVTSVVVQAASASPEDNAAALEAAAQVAPTTSEEALAQIKAKETASERPSWLDPKFNSPEDMAKAYAELQAKLGSSEEPKPEEVSEETPEENTEEEKPKEEEEAPLAKVDVAAFEAEYAEKGELSEESYAKLEGLGFSRSVVDAYKKGQEALAQIVTNRITEAAGGKEELDAVLLWAKTGLTSEEIDQTNTVFSSGDAEAATLKMQEVRQRYLKATGSDPKKFLEGDQTVRATGYQSWDEVIKDQSSEEYRTNETFRAKVYAKLARSNI